MKKTLLILFTFHFSLFAFAQSADDFYRMEDYSGAIAAYEETLTDGHTSPELYYNLAGAYYREGDMAKAILNSERALRLKPNFSDASENLALANSHITDRIVTLPRLFVVRWWDALVVGVTPHGWRIVWLVLLAIVAAATVLFFIGRNSTLRKAALLSAAGSLLLLILATVFLVGSTHRYNARLSAIIMEPSVTLKASPDSKSIDKMILHSGTKAQISDSLQGWYKITIADGTTGWCPQPTIERI